MRSHPTYVPSEGLWYTDEGLSAPTLRELLKVMPRGSTLQDYFPGGSLPTVWEPRTTQSGSARTNHIKPPERALRDLKLARAARSVPSQPAAGPPPPSVAPVAEVPAVAARGMGRVGPRPNSQRYSHEVILNLWNQKWTARAIAERMGCPSIATINEAVRSARRRGDSRALSRQGRPGHRERTWTEPRVRHLLELARDERGLSAGVMACWITRENPQLAVTRAMVISKLASLGVALPNAKNQGRPRPEAPQGEAQVA